MLPSILLSSSPTRADVQVPVEQSRDLHYYLHEYLLTRVTRYADGPTHSQVKIESDHRGRFTSMGQYAFTAEQFLSPGSVTTFHILLPHVQTWLAFSSLRDQDSLPLNLSLRL